MSEIIILTIGPVQSYISQARRTQDLWQGSRILSYLASAGVHYARHQSQAEVIYPAITRDDQTTNIPNRMVVRWNGDSSEARVCADAMEKAIRRAWQTLSANTLNYFIDSDTMDQTARERVMSIWQRQEATWLECYWVVMPYEENNHATSVNTANAALGARKLIRDFPQIQERGRKCSITGEHEALHDGDVVRFWDARQAEQRNLALLGKHERLSAVSAIKRFAHEGRAGNDTLQFPNRFPSTSSIAAAPFKYDVLRALDDPANRDVIRPALERYIEKLLALFKKPGDLFFKKDGSYNEEYFDLVEKQISTETLADELARQFRSIDGDFLFEDTLIGKTIEEYSQRKPLDGEMRAAQTALADLIKAAQSLGITRPQPYLVILTMDGDNMGKTLGGLQNAGQHRLFSETLATFARDNVIQIVEQDHLGRVVYAGGDDVLALLPVCSTLQVADELRSQFETTVANIGVKNHKGDQVTASTGLAYVHHTHNLQDAVHAAHAAQKVAKDKKRYARNAVVVEFLRRSGEPRTMGCKWVTNDTSNLDHVIALADAFGDGLSRNLPYDVAQITYKMAGPIVPDDARRAELERIIRRRLPEEKRAIAANITAHILALVDASSGSLKTQWENVQRWLELARFVAQKEGDL